MTEDIESATFHCPRWPHCGCPDGAVRADCPGLAQQAKTAASDEQAAPGFGDDE